MKACRDFLKIYVCKEAVDFRKGIFSLSQLVAMDMEHNPLDGSLYVFVNRLKTSLRCLYWNKTGFALWIKVLEKNRFPWPKAIAGQTIELTSSQLEWLIDGIDIWKLKPHPELNYSRIV